KILSTKQWQDIGFVPGNGTTTKPIAYAFKDLVNFNGIYLYRLKQIDFSGKFTFSNEISVEVTSLLNDFALEQNYPNPFNPSTIISFTLPNKEFVKLSIFNIIGEEVATLINNELEAGWYRHEFNASSLSSGIYFYTLQAGKFSETKKMILVR
ncbi:MAG TPA: T9SS type A sorting domain-containing protein, partial [Melioribacteraceae bacterium]|nr:T9SS type A sorting domain-containing protein [Melioribacteraceae bacterium]